MTVLFDKPLDELAVRIWQRVDPAYRNAALAVVIVNLLAFGFEMTNLTLNHDDSIQLFIRSPDWGSDLGRFGLGWLHYYGQSHHIMPFLQMAVAIAVMTLCSLLIAHFWGLRRTIDAVVVGSVVCTFPFFAQMYQYNTSMATYSVAHLLATIAVLVSTRATVKAILVAALLYMAAFSIYQSVAAWSAVIFLFWALNRTLFPVDGEFFSRSTAKAAAAAAAAAVAGGVLYVGAIWALDIQLDSYQGAADAFRLTGNRSPLDALTRILADTRAYYFWPENYFPDYLKKLQLIFATAAAGACVVLPRTIAAKAVALFLLLVALIVAPRALQLLHPAGNYHNLTLTAYAVVIAGCVMMLLRVRAVPIRSGVLLAATVLLSGYVNQSNWISMVNLLNTTAHFTAASRVLERVQALPRDDWDGKTVVVFGRHTMMDDYPFKRATGIAKDYLDAEHIPYLFNLQRADMTLLPVDRASANVRQFVAERPAWPDPRSVGIVDGVAVVVLSKEQPGG